MEVGNNTEGLATEADLTGRRKEEWRQLLSEVVVGDESGEGINYLRFRDEVADGTFQQDRHFYPQDGVVAFIDQAGRVSKVERAQAGAGGGSLNGVRVEFDEKGNRLDCSPLPIEERQGSFGERQITLVAAKTHLGKTFNGYVPAGLVIGEDGTVLAAERVSALQKKGGQFVMRHRIVLKDPVSERSVTEEIPEGEAGLNQYRYVFGIK